MEGFFMKETKVPNQAAVQKTKFALVVKSNVKAGPPLTVIPR